MLHKLQQRKDAGFTIIEVMIVLAIAGLIMLIVFLAVPALQRNAHNTSIKNDVASLLGAMNEYANNNNGTLAGYGSITAGTATFKAASGTNCSTAGSNCATTSVGYVTTTSVTASVPNSAPAIGTVTIITSATCSGNTPQGGATTRNYVAYFQLEGGAVQCQAS